jgi:hypothetical protein
MSMSGMLYKPVSLLLGLAAGALASAVFKQVWGLVAGEDEAPEATSPDHSWAEVLAAAAVQGAVFATVKAAVDRGGAEGVRRITGRWPG